LFDHVVRKSSPHPGGRKEGRKDRHLMVAQEFFAARPGEGATSVEGRIRVGRKNPLVDQHHKKRETAALTKTGAFLRAMHQKERGVWGLHHRGEKKAVYIPFSRKINKDPAVLSTGGGERKRNFGSPSRVTDREVERTRKSLLSCAGGERVGSRVWGKKERGSGDQPRQSGLRNQNHEETKAETGGRKERRIIGLALNLCVLASQHPRKRRRRQERKKRGKKRSPLSVGARQGKKILVLLSGKKRGRAQKTHTSLQMLTKKGFFLLVGGKEKKS